MTADEERDQQITLVRHAETEWSVSGQHTGTTDLPLTDEGRRKSERIAERLGGRRLSLVLSSPLARALETACIAGYRDVAELRDELAEWDYGAYEGLTTAEIREQDPGWELWTDGAPDGESPTDVRDRVDRVVEELRGRCEAGQDVAVFGHGHLLRALAVRWVGFPIEAGRHFRLSTGTISTLGWKRELRVIDTWNDASHLMP